MKQCEHEAERAAFEAFWLETRGARKAHRELLRHPLQHQTYIADSANRHWVTWQAALITSRAKVPRIDPKETKA